MPITDLHPDHIPSAVALWETCGLTRPWNDPTRDAERALRGPASTILGYYEGAALIGTAMVGAEGHRAWVYYLAVDPDRRGEGHGRELMAACEAWALSHDMPKLHLLVRRGNDAVLGFYQALGYEDGDVVMLGKRLDPTP